VHRLQALTQVLTQPSPTHFIELAAFTAIAACFLFFLYRVELSAVFSLGFALESFSGNWKYVPFPLPLDRVVLLVGLILLILRGTPVEGRRRIVLQPIHFLLLGVVGYVIANSIWAGTLGTSYGFYALLDRLGVLPFLMYTLAPKLFSTERQRNHLLIAMVALGLYLGFDALAEGLKVSSLIVPRYINNQALGITGGRARGPFLESVAMGLALFDCAVFAAIALNFWTRRAPRMLCAITLVLSPIGILFTLTRSVWIGAVLGLVGGMGFHPKLRRYLVPVLVVLAAVTIGALVIIPGLSNKVQGRVDTTRSVWDRYNTNYAALRAFKANPLFGIGWQTFETKGVGYLREAATYPLTGQGLEVHNVFLSHLAELGLGGAALWTLALLTGIGGAVLRRCPPELFAWKAGLLAMFLMFVLVGNLVPLSYPLPNLLLWLMAGIVSQQRSSVSWSKLAHNRSPYLVPSLVGAGLLQPRLNPLPRA
jgi:putative inorganic carbon (HCO3(-)) transporter